MRLSKIRIPAVYLPVIVALLNFGSVSAQFTNSYAYLQRTRDTVLMNTDHFYIGFEAGMDFNLGPTSTIVAGSRIVTNGEPFGMNDFNFLGHTKGFIGYAYKSHHFEGALGSMSDRVNVTLQDSLGNNKIRMHSSRLYVTASVRYFYRFPIKVKRLKMMMGAELGGGFSPPFFQQGAQISTTDTSYLMSASSLTDKRFQMLIGVHGRMDIKIRKNVTFILMSSVIFSPLRGSEYSLTYQYPGNTYQNARVAGSILNLNLSIGLKLDFFSHKKKKETYDKYGIEDPFRDK